MSDFKKTKVLRGIEPLRIIFDDVASIGGIFCGGYVRYMVSLKENPPSAQDIDIYSPSEEVYNELTIYFKRLGLKVNKESDYSISFKIKYDKNGRISCPPSDINMPISNFLWDHERTIIQLVKPINKGRMVCKGNLEEVLSNFDFTIVRCGLISLTEALVDNDFHSHDERNILIFKNIHSPISSIFRIVKYGQKGYRIRPSHLVKLFFDWDERDPEWKNRVKETIYKFEKNGFGSKSRVRNIDAVSIDEMTELESLLFVGDDI